jgi:heme/copper-type cytochrome/quinol oxidase subunit 2
VTPLRWTALIAALVLIVPATIAIVRAFWPYGRDDGEGRARALEALWTVVPVAGLVVLVAYSVAAE